MRLAQLLRCTDPTHRRRKAWRCWGSLGVSGRSLQRVHSVAEVGFLCGFADQPHITREFERRAAAVLRAPEGQSEGLSLGEIATRVGLPRSTVQRIVNTRAACSDLRSNGLRVKRSFPCRS